MAQAVQSMLKSKGVLHEDCSLMLLVEQSLRSPAREVKPDLIREDDSQAVAGRQLLQKSRQAEEHGCALNVGSSRFPIPCSATASSP